MSSLNIAEYGWLGSTGIIVIAENTSILAMMDLKQGYGIVTLLGFGVLILGGRCVDLYTKFKKQNAGTDSGKLTACLEAGIMQKKHFEYILSLNEEEKKLLTLQITQLHKLIQEQADTIIHFNEIFKAHKKEYDERKGVETHV